MKTVDEILSTWEDEGRYADWYAIDGYNPIDGMTRRLFVGTYDEAADMMRTTYAMPTDLVMQCYHRCSTITPEEALAYFRGDVYETDEGRWMSTAQAAELLGVNRQRVVQLIAAGKLDAVKVGRSYNVSAASVDARIAAMRD